jgi:hypothetical protein
MKFSITISDLEFADYVEFTKRLTGLSAVAELQVAAGHPPAAAAPQADAQAPVVTVAAVRLEVGKHMEGELGKKLKALIKDYGVKALAEIPADKLPEYLEKARALIKSEGAAA